jgi:hypothetical protein
MVNGYLGRVLAAGSSGGTRAAMLLVMAGGLVAGSATDADDKQTSTLRRPRAADVVFAREVANVLRADTPAFRQDPEMDPRFMAAVEANVNAFLEDPRAFVREFLTNHDVQPVAARPDRPLLTPPGAPGPEGDQYVRARWFADLQGWGQQHPYDACAWALENLSARECESLLGLTSGVATHLGKKDFADGLVLLAQFRRFDDDDIDGGNNNQPRRTLFRHLMDKFVCGSLLSNPDAALKLAEHYCDDGLYELAAHAVEDDPSQALAILASVERWDGQLPRVTAFDFADSVKVAQALAARTGPLKLPNLKKISPKTLAALLEKEDVEIPLIETLELIPEPDGSPTEDFVIPEGLQQRQKQQAR